jgi:nucleoside-diphosphate-sugar epimerase
MSKILLTGSSGFLGKEIKSKIASNNIIFELNSKSGHFKTDLRNEIPNFNINFDLVIHAAGKAHQTAKTIKEINDFNEINYNGTQNLLNGLNKDLKVFIYISSVSVYGLTKGTNINEEENLLAKDPYGISKIKAENLVKDWCLKNNIKFLILRLPLIVGVNPPGNLGSMIKAIKNGYYFNIAGGTAKKSMVLASDIAFFILKAAEIGGTYNLTDGTHPTFNQLSNVISLNFTKTYIPNLPFLPAKILSKIGDLIGEDFPINSNKFNKIISTLTFNDEKARIAFGWNPTPVLEGFKLY